MRACVRACVRACFLFPATYNFISRPQAISNNLASGADPGGGPSELYEKLSDYVSLKHKKLS